MANLVDDCPSCKLQFVEEFPVETSLCWRFPNEKCPFPLFLEGVLNCNVRTEDIQLVLFKIPGTFPGVIALVIPQYWLDTQQVQIPMPTYINTYTYQHSFFLGWYLQVPAVLHKAVAAVSKIDHCRRTHWWTERWLELGLLEWLQWPPHAQLLNVVWCGVV